MTEEIWKDVPGYEGLYQASDAGRIRNAKGRVLCTQVINSGYAVLHLTKDGKRKTALVHRVVASAFCVQNGPEVNHRNKIRLDNRAVNLEWLHHSENIRHAMESGSKFGRSYAVVGTCKLTGLEIKFDSQQDAERALTGRNSSAVHHCLIGKKKSAYGYVWRRS